MGYKYIINRENLSQSLWWGAMIQGGGGRYVFFLSLSRIHEFHDGFHLVVHEYVDVPDTLNNHLFNNGCLVKQRFCNHFVCSDLEVSK